MGQNNNPFRLPLREPLKSGDRSYTETSFQQWLDELPLADPVKTALGFYSKLKKLNQLEVPAAQRLSNLDQVLPRLMEVLSSLVLQSQEEAHPLSQRTRRVVELIGASYLLMAKSYKVALDQYHHESIAGHLLHKQQRATALHRMIYLLGRGMLHFFTHYQPVPRYLWHELHHTYLYGVEHHLSERRLETGAKPWQRLATANELYRQILLLAAAGPYRFLQGEAVRVYQALLHLLPGCHLYRLGQEMRGEALLIVDCSSDDGPRYLDSERDQSISNGWLLETSALAMQLSNELDDAESELGAIRPSEDQSQLSSELLAKLMLSLGVGIKRSAERSRVAGEVQLIPGFCQLYEALGGNPIPQRREQFKVDDSEAVFQEMSRQELEDKQADEMYQSRMEQVWGASGWMPQSNAKEQLATPEQHTADSAESHTTYIVLDESPNGFHLGVVGTPRDKLRVGEVVGIVRNDEEASEIHSGVIRWLKAENNSLLEFGVELFAAELQPVIFGRHCSRETREYYRGFQLRLSEEEEFLLTEPFYSEGFDDGVLLSEHAELEIRLSRVLEQTGSFLQFQIIETEPENTEEIIVLESGESFADL